MYICVKRLLGKQHHKKFTYNNAFKNKVTKGCWQTVLNEVDTKILDLKSFGIRSS